MARRTATPARGEEAPRKLVGRPSRLSRELIVSAAVDVTRESGLPSVTMRALADRLEATPMALYRHVGDREQLAVLVVDAIFRKLELPSASLAAVPWLRELALRARAIGRAHRGVMDVLLDQGPVAGSTLVILDAVAQKLHDAGLPWKEAAGIHNTFFSWIAATVRREERWASEGPQTAKRFMAAAAAMSADHPALAHVLPHMPGADVDAELAFSLAFMLGAVEARLAAHRSKKRR